MAHPIFGRIRGIATSGGNYATGITRIIPDLLDKLANDRDTTACAMLLNVCQNVSPRDGARVKALIGACIVSGLTMTSDKATKVWSVTIRSVAKGGLVVSDNKIGVLRSLGDEEVRFHSDKIDRALFDEKESESKPFDLSAAAKRLVKAAHEKGNATDSEILTAVMSYLKDLAPQAQGPVKGDDVEDAEIVETTTLTVAA